jgi:glucokinase
MNSKKNGRIVLTLDAGGTNFVFSAVQSDELIVEPLSYPSSSDDLEKCLATLLKGFDETMKKVSGRVEAISFAFPGPADYDRGIIGDLPNFKAFNDFVAVGPMLEEEFGLPVFINNDGNLYAYGEALSGYLPELNRRIIEKGGIRQFRNLIGLTLGTGFGCGFVIDGKMLKGDNSSDSGIYLVPDKFNTNWGAEESVSTRSIQRVYCEQRGIPFSPELMPRDIYDIATGNREGDRAAATESFRKFGEGLGNAVAGLLTLIDGIVVIGGGIVSAWDLFAPAMFEEIERNYETFDGRVYPRLPFRVFNLENEKDFEEFAKGQVRTIRIPGSEKTMDIDSIPRVGIAASRIGASKAISLGAYAYANQQLDALS